MAISKRIRRQKRNRPKRSSKGTITIRTICPETERRKEKAIRTKLQVKQDAFIKNLWVVTIIRNDGLTGLTTVTSKETPTKEHPSIKRLIKNLRV
tara:strand:- start:334 stop:618 length:285 start_codon:yes stop_codon:yes gene_type:complete